MFGQGAHKALRIHAVNATKQSSDEYPDKLMDCAQSQLNAVALYLLIQKEVQGLFSQTSKGSSAKFKIDPSLISRTHTNTKTHRDSLRR